MIKKNEVLFVQFDKKKWGLICSIFYGINDFFWSKLFRLVVSFWFDFGDSFHFFSRGKAICWVLWKNKVKKLISDRKYLFFYSFCIGHKTYTNIYSDNYWKAHFFCSLIQNLMNRFIMFETWDFVFQFEKHCRLFVKPNFQQSAK